MVRAPIWVVPVDGDLYVRSWKGDAGHWYRRARRHGTGSIVTADGEYAVRFEPTAEPGLEAAVDQGYLSKYGDSSYAAAMIHPPAAGTTLRVTPAP